jgi:hypothetical protein
MKGDFLPPSLHPPQISLASLIPFSSSRLGRKSRTYTLDVSFALCVLKPSHLLLPSTTAPAPSQLSGAPLGKDRVSYSSPLLSPSCVPLSDLLCLHLGLSSPPFHSSSHLSSLPTLPPSLLPLFLPRRI